MTSEAARSDSAATTRRERQRRATTEEIVATARELLTEPDGLSLRSVAARMGITAPALYRYVDSYQALVYLVADAVDADMATRIREDAELYPADDPAAQIVAAAIGFRRWALARREEFGLLFTNPVTSNSLVERDAVSGSRVSEEFTEIFERLYTTYRFPFPATADLPADVADCLREPTSPNIPCVFPEELIGLGWVYMRAWAALYGTVTLEVYGHLDPQLSERGSIFRAMLIEQSAPLGLAAEMARLQPMIDAELARR